jgi:hypothetical protein
LPFPFGMTGGEDEFDEDKSDEDEPDKEYQEK